MPVYLFSTLAAPERIIKQSETFKELSFGVDIELIENGQQQHGANFVAQMDQRPGQFDPKIESEVLREKLWWK